MKSNLQNEELRVCYSLGDYLENPDKFDILNVSADTDLGGVSLRTLTY